jgi:serine/threonine protein kinase
MSEEQLFIELLNINDLKERSTFLESRCGVNTPLGLRMQALLCAHESAGDFLETPAGREVATHPGSQDVGPGTVIGRYQVVGVLGEGGMGTVYRARQFEPVQREVALKLIRYGAASLRVLERFESERQTLAIMDHPNIAKVFDAGSTEQGQPYFVMELIEGRPITRYCDDQRLTPEQRLELMVPVCQAVQHAHQKGAIHRDLKPTNILIVEYDGKPTPKIIDFGVAKALCPGVATNSEAGPGLFLEGTPEYMSPEQATLDSLDVDSRSDVYSLGVVLYELLTGTTPLRLSLLKTHSAGEAESVLRRIREYEPPAPGARLLEKDTQLTQVAHNRNVPPLRLQKRIKGELDWIVMKALDKERGRRYDTALDLGSDLQHYLADEPLQAAPPIVSYRMRKFVSKYRWAVAAVIVGILTLVIVTIISLGFAYQAAWAENLAVNESHRATSERNRAVTAEHEATLARDQALAAQRQAQEEATATRAAIDFLINDVFLEADPQRNPRARQMTVHELIDRASTKLPGKFELQPVNEAMIRQVLGVLYRKLGHLAVAETHLERALELRRAHLGESDGHTLNSMDALAVVYDARHQRTKAEALMRRSYEMGQQVLGPEHTQTRTSMANLGVLLLHVGKLQEADPLLSRTYQLNKSQLGDDNLTTLASLHNLATLRMEQGRLGEAEQLIEKTLVARRRLLGDDNPRVIASMQTQGVICLWKSQHQKAGRTLNEALQLSRKVLGPEHPTTLTLLRCLAFHHESEGKAGLAEPIYREILEHQKKAGAHEIVQQAETLLFLGDNLLLQAKYSQAKEVLLQSETMWKGHEQATWLRKYGELLRGVALLGNGEPEAGERWLRQGCQGCQEILETSTWRTRVFLRRAVTRASLMSAERGLTVVSEHCRELSKWIEARLVVKSSE